MNRMVIVGIALAGLLAADGVSAADLTLMPVKAPRVCDPYTNYKCLDSYLGDDFLTRLTRYYALEWGRDAAPSDPKAPPSRREGWPATPMTTPPMPFTEWPYGGATAIGVTRPNSVDSPLMVALGNTALGKAMNDAHIQVYGWVNFGGNLSTNRTKPGGNWPAGYDYTPNTVQLDQAVVYVERLPDTVQKDHIDWGFRVAGLYGETYRYTTAYGLFSNQLLKSNNVHGGDMPMAYGEVYIPYYAEGLLLRFGRYSTIPDIESQLAPYNYMYSHSMLYTFDNSTTTGIQGTLAVTKNWFVQLALSAGTEAVPWHVGKKITNPFPNPLYPDSTMLKNPGAVPSVTGAVRWTSDSGNDSFYLVADVINNGEWGYNNLQWFGGTYYHKFDDKWHISMEAYYLYQRNVPNANNAFVTGTIIPNGGTPFAPLHIPFNAPSIAQCSDPAVLSCTAGVFAAVGYLNYRATSLDNISLRAEYYDDMQGQRTGTKSRYVETALGWQHWFSPQVVIRPEIAYYKSLDAPAFNGNFNAGIAPNKGHAVIASMDMIWKF